MTTRDKTPAAADQAELEALAQLLELATHNIRTGACHASHEQLAGVMDLVGRMTAPSNILTSYQVCRELGITARTLYTWVSEGVMPEPHQLAGAGNTNFWYQAELDQARRKIKKRHTTTY